MLRNVKDATVSTLSTDVSAKLSALKGLQSRLLEIQEYLGLVQEGKLPLNQDILTYLQVSRCFTRSGCISCSCRALVGWLVAILLANYLLLVWEIVYSVWSAVYRGACEAALGLC